ncbi:hypothetical protein [Kitasatospora sp. NPDC127116]|uniref:hypothetical protein n=1 Tax=unclassified Kitasatospora TaxID=2633591 RepID=UPI00362AA061
MPDSQPREQRNDGPGTFINGNVEGGVRNLFFFESASGNGFNRHKQESRSPKERSETEDDDDPGDALLGTIALGSMPLGAIGHSIGLLPVGGWSDHPSILERLLIGLAGIIGLILCTACALARLAQIFALWAARASGSAKANAPRHGRIAAGNARTASSAALFAHISAGLTSALAVLFAWFSLGATVSRRAHDAAGEAAASATAAWAHVREISTKPR